MAVFNIILDIFKNVLFSKRNVTLKSKNADRIFEPGFNIQYHLSPSDDFQDTYVYVLH